MNAPTLLILTAMAASGHLHDYRQLALTVGDVRDISIVCHRRFHRHADQDACIARRT